MIEFWLPMIASILQSGIGNALSANQATNQRNEDIRIAGLRRKELQPIIDQLQQARDYFGVEEQLVRDFSRASNQMAAQSAQTGMTNAGSGGLDQVRGDLLGSMLASLAELKLQDDSQRQQLLAQILSDPSLYDGSRTPGSAVGNTILGGLLGGVAGAGTQLTSYLSTPEGIEILSGLLGGNANALAADSTQAAGVYATPMPPIAALAEPTQQPAYSLRIPTIPEPQPVGLPGVQFRPAYVYRPLPGGR